LIQIDHNKLLSLLNKVYVWLPHDNPMRNEVLNVIRELKGQLQ